jgi:hypothetical protein
MPYIAKSDRERFKPLLDYIEDATITCAGELNYLLTQLTYAYLRQRKESYQSYNDAMGALEGAKLELYRRSIAKYEDVKIVTNGDVP